MIREVPTRVRVRVVEERRLNPGEARNVGVQAATCDWIAFADGGTEPDSRWLEALMSPTAEGRDVVFGSYDPSTDSMFRRCAALAYVSSRCRAGIRGPFVASMVVRRKVFDAVGGFPRFRASEDLVFIERILAGDFRVAYAPAAVVQWDTPQDMHGTFRRFALYSRINLEAGRAATFHCGVFRHYLLLAVVLAFAILVSVPGFMALAVIAAFFLARALRAAARKQDDLPFAVWRPHLLVGAAAILVLVDAAVMVGVLWFVVRWPFRLRRDPGEST